MSAPAPTPAERRLALLEQVAELGIGFMRAMQDDVAAAHEVQAEQARLDPTCRLFPPFDFAETSHAFTRLSRAVRLTLALHARLEAGAYRPFPLPPAPNTIPPAPGRADSAAPLPRAAHETESHERLSDPEELDAWLKQPHAAGAPQALWAEAADTADDLADDAPSRAAVPYDLDRALQAAARRTDPTKAPRARGP